MIASNLSRNIRPSVRTRVSLLQRIAKQSTTPACSILLSSIGRNSPPHPIASPCTNMNAAYQAFSTDSSNSPDTAAEKVESTESIPNENVSSGPRRLPVRHSRHLPPPTAPAHILDAETNEILNSPLGSLIAYQPNETKQTKFEVHDEAQALAHPIQEKVLYIMRGYANLIDGSIVQTHKTSYEIPESESDLHLSPSEIVQRMIQLVKRMEKEGEVYVQVGSKFRFQQAQQARSSMKSEDEPVSLTALTDGRNEKKEISSSKSLRGFLQSMKGSSDEEDTDDDDYTELETEESEEEKNAWRLESLALSFGAPPGPTTAMYDLILDAHACLLSQSKDDATTISLLKTSVELLEQVENREDLDRAQGFGSNKPTQCTYNSILRGCASLSPSVTEEVRDLALLHSSRIYDTMIRSESVVRNSATYAYYLEVVRNFLPKCESTGTMAYYVWHQAMTEDHVIDVNVVDSLLKFEEGYGSHFDKFVQETRDRFDESTNGFGFPMMWSRNKNLRKYHKRHTTY